MRQFLALPFTLFGYGFCMIGVSLLGVGKRLTQKERSHDRRVAE